MRAGVDVGIIAAALSVAEVARWRAPEGAAPLAQACRRATSRVGAAALLRSVVLGFLLLAEFGEEVPIVAPAFLRVAEHAVGF